MNTRSFEGKPALDIPGPKSRAILEERNKYVPQAVFNVTPVFANKARGAVLEDVDGNTFLDFAGGIGVLNAGGCPPEVVAAVKDQAENFLHTCFHVVMYESYVALARKLAGITPGDYPKKTVLVNSGAEAVENGIKIARKYTGRNAVITFENAFHGRTLLAMSLTSKVAPYKLGFGPFAPEVYRVPSAYCYRCIFGETYPSCNLRCIDNLERVIKVDIGPDQVAAIIAEPVQGEGGFIVPPAEFFSRLKEVCDRHRIVLIIDEVQTGFGRTGRLLASEHFGIEPDVILMAKSLAAGLPLGAVTARAELMDAVHVGGLGGTFGGNPLSCRAALEVIKIMETNRLPERALEIGKETVTRLKILQSRYPEIGDVRALGAMVAMEFVKDPMTKEPAKELTGEILQECHRNGLILMTAGVYGNVIRLLMPLVITDDHLHQGLDILEGSIQKVLGKG